MNTQWTVILVTAAIVSTAARSLAGDPVAAQDAGVTSIVRGAYGLSETDGLLLGLGPDYRAEFLDDGMRFVPALGRTVTRSLPLEFRMETIGRGADVLVDTQLARAVRSSGGNTVRYMHAAQAGVVERYDVRADGLELSFGFERRPAGSGDLVVRGRVQTDLAPGVATHEGGLWFAAPGGGGVTIGAVSGVDANGWQVAGSIRLVGEQVEFNLPGAFVDQARYPIVLDPLVGATINIGVGWDDMNPDVAYDAGTDTYLVVWQREFSGSDIDLRSQRVSGTGLLVGGVAAVTTSADVNINPTVANVNLRDRFLVCWQVGPSVFGPWDIVGRTVAAADGSTSAVVTIAGDAGISETDPDAGGESTNVDDDALVVWDHGLGTSGAQVTLPSTGDPSVLTTFVVATGNTDDFPTISKSGGSAGRYVVAWQRDFGGSSGLDIRAAAIDRNGTLLDTFQAITSTLTQNELYPDVDGDGGRWAIVFQRQEATGSAEHDIYCVPLVLDTGTGQLSQGVAAAVEADASDDEIQPAVAFLGAKFAVTWTDENQQPFNYSLSLREIEPGTCVLCGLEYSLSTSGSFSAGGEIASVLSGGGTGDQAFVVYHQANDAPPFDGDVNGQLIEAIGTGGAIITIGGGCGASGTITAVGPAALGNAGFALALTGGDLVAPAAILNLNLASTAIPCQSCMITPIFFLVPLPMVAGNVLAPLPIPCDPSFVGFTVECQFIMQNTAQTPCFKVGVGTSFSSRLRFTVGN